MDLFIAYFSVGAFIVWLLAAFVQFYAELLGASVPWDVSTTLPSEPEKPMTDEEINDMLRMMR